MTREKFMGLSDKLGLTLETKMLNFFFIIIIIIFLYTLERDVVLIHDLITNACTTLITTLPTLYFIHKKHFHYFSPIN